MTNHWVDYRHSDVHMIIGVNTAECHPASMRHINLARKNRGAKIIAVDPRFTRTAAVADLYMQLRPGTDIAFFGGLINYVLQNELYHREYVEHYTNASYLVNPAFSLTDGVFSGLVNDSYDKDTWSYQYDADGNILKDPTLQDPNCVFQLLKQHYSRYDVDTVCNIVGCDKDTFLEVADLYASTGAPDKVGNILYAMGITQHTKGSQNVRAIAMVQLLLGNVGRVGGGVNAQRVESNVQGATDMAQLFHILPGYMPTPVAAAHPTFEAYNDTQPETGYWSNRHKFITSLLKAWWGDHAAAVNDYRYDYLGKLDGKNRSHMGIFEEMYNGNIKGFFAWGQNPLVGGPNVSFEAAAMDKLDWCVVIDPFETETAAFWKRPAVNPDDIQTEVFFLPAAVSFEKPGIVTNSGRVLQWRDEAVAPPGDARNDLWIADRLYKAIKKEYEGGGVFPDPILQLNWDYGDGPDNEKVQMEINGYYTTDGSLVENFTKLEADGSTACGNWIHSGYFNDPNDPHCKRREREPEGGLGLHPNWGFAWPLNRRIVYNRCSADPAGKPWDEERALLWYEDGEWKGHDVPDFNAAIPPEESAVMPFIMLPEMQARLFSAPMAEGPFPEHYEPAESPVENLLSARQTNPCLVKWSDHSSPLAAVGDPDFPYIGTTARVTEHWQSGAITRNCPWLNELMPDAFVEISEELAAELGINSGDKVIVSTRRGEVEVIACVTTRLKALKLNGREVEVVNVPWHWGYKGMSTGASANDLTAHVGDANTSIPEYKAFLCNVRRA